MTWNQAIQFIQDHQGMISLAALAVVKVLPPPGTPFTPASMYKYGYDLLHAYFHVSTPPVPGTLTITPPVLVPDPKALPKENQP